jgi:hypothetical protein
MRRKPQIDRLSDFMLTQSFFSKSDCPRQIDRYIDFFGSSASIWIPRGISQPSTKTLEAVDKLVGIRRSPVDRSKLTSSGTKLSPERPKRPDLQHGFPRSSKQERSTAGPCCRPAPEGVRAESRVSRSAKGLNSKQDF